MNNIEIPNKIEPLTIDPLNLSLFKQHSLKHLNRKTRQFYVNQNKQIDYLLQTSSTQDSNINESIAIYASLAANIILLALQVYAALTTRSISLFATLADCFMDLVSNLVIIYSTHIAKSKYSYFYPAGRAKMETVGIIVFASLMATLSIQLIIEGIRNLTSNTYSATFEISGFIVIGVAIVIKSLLFFYCYVNRKYPLVEILALDHRNDIVLNLFGVAFSIVGSLYVNWLDPAGGILIACLIFRSWSSTCFENIQLVIGKSADNLFLQKITYISLFHDSRIVAIDTCRAYSSGSNFFVEVDIVLPPAMSLKEAHDIGEALQMKLERVENIERAFVHLDFEATHVPEHGQTPQKISPPAA